MSGRAVRVVTGFLVVGTAVAGCGTATDSGRPSAASPPHPSASLTSVVQDAASERAQQSLWSTTDGAVLAEEDPDVQAIRALVIRHAELVSNRSETTISASAVAERRAYSTRFTADLDVKGYFAKLVRMYRDSQLDVRQSQLAWYPSTVATSRITAEAHVGSTMVITSATPGYLNRNKLTRGASYEELRRISLVKTKGSWRIDNIEKAPLRPVASSPAPSS